MVHTSDAILASVILLKGRLKGEIAESLMIEKSLEKSRVMGDFLKGITNMPTEGREINWSSQSYSLLEQLLIAHLCTLHNAKFLCK